MYLKALEIAGFKSFADRTKIEFDQGITAIVGPNGAGKSNITEALRWALGEQSAKSLRGGKMPDVIFSGTEKRKAQNAAEVVAHFDNRDRYLDWEADEVVITRRLYRNGDSDYLINGKKRRLRDVHDLFMDTGTGRDSLSIISQGRVEQIFNAKPEERRAIFEEAAGVLKYKTRKSETESKLKGTQENLDRLEDIIFELNGQLTPLRAQRDVAVRFAELDGARRELQLAVLVAQIDEELEKRTTAQTGLAELLSELKGLEAAQADVEKEGSALKAQRAQVEADLEALAAELLQLTELKSEAGKRLELYDAAQLSSEKSAKERSARLAELTAQQEGLTTQLAENAESLETLRVKREEGKSTLRQLTESLAAFEESPEAVMERLREDYLQLVNQEASLSNRLTKNRADMENNRLRAVENDESVRETVAKEAAAVADLADSEAALAALKEEIEQLLAAYQAAAAEEKQLAADFEQAQKQQMTALNDLQKQKARLASLEAIRENHSNLYAGVQAVMKRDFAGIIGVMADLLTFDKQYATALDIALGAGAQNIVVEDETAAREAIRYLRDNRLGRATFLPLTTIKPRDFRDYSRVRAQKGFIDLAVNLVSYDGRLQNAVSNLLGTTVIVDTLENAQNIARALNFTVRIVTLDGSQINPGGSFAGGAGKRNATTFTVNDIAVLTEEIAKADEALRAQEKAVRELLERRKLLEQKLTRLREEGEEKRLTERELELKVGQLRQTRDDLQELLALSQTTDAGQLDTLAADNQAIEAELAELAERKTGLEAEQDRVRSSSSELNALKTAKSDELTAMKVELSEVDGELRHHGAEKQRLTAALSELEEQLARLQSAGSADTAALSTNRTQLSEQLSAATAKLQALQVSQVSLRLERDDLSAQLEDISQQNSGAVQARQELANRQTRLEIELEQLEKTLKFRQLTLSEDYQLSYEAAKVRVQGVGEAVQGEQQQPERMGGTGQASSQGEGSESRPGLLAASDLPQAEKQLRELERQIRALGPVNSEAIAQFDEVSKRHSFLSGQRDDVLEAKQALLSTINDMDDEVKIRFETTFRQIKDSFLLTFQQMFTGGNAELQLTTDDLLTAGIDINVQPPGKKLASLQLMSGGEKALTALALLFAILRVRTVPFVVLDEVEAALDEANVKRFGDYMNNFDSSNQFIVVTHRKGTMAAADVMYGVTMLDAGVSKLVSVRFDEVAKVEEASGL